MTDSSWKASWVTVIKKMKSKGGGKDSPSLFAGLMQELQPMVGIASPEGKLFQLFMIFWLSSGPR